MACIFESRGQTCPCPHLHNGIGAAAVYDHNNWGTNKYVPLCGHKECADKYQCATPGIAPDLALLARYGMVPR